MAVFRRGGEYEPAVAISLEEPRIIQGSPTQRFLQQLTTQGVIYAFSEMLVEPLWKQRVWLPTGRIPVEERTPTNLQRVFPQWAEAIRTAGLDTNGQNLRNVVGLKGEPQITFANLI